jgi:hypothetical protein
MLNSCTSSLVDDNGRRRTAGLARSASGAAALLLSLLFVDQLPAQTAACVAEARRHADSATVATLTSLTDCILRIGDPLNNRPPLFDAGGKYDQLGIPRPTGRPICERCIVRIQQSGTKRSVDAWVDKDYGLVTRPLQENATQMWDLKHLGDHAYVIKHMSTGRFVDAYEDRSHAHLLVTRPWQGDLSQVWSIKRHGGGWYSIMQVSTGRLVDADDGTQDYRLVARTGQIKESGRWAVTVLLRMSTQ